MNRSAPSGLRLFFALELPAEVRAALARLRPRESAPGAADYRWVEPDLLHITLAFLGQQPVEALPALRMAGETTAREARSGVLTLGEAGQFGPRRAPRVLWVGVGGDLAGLTALQARLAAQLVAAGFALEDRPFRPHLTLARQRARASGGAPTFWPPRTLPPARFAFDAFVLMRSDLSSAGPRYTVLEQFDLPP